MLEVSLDFETRSPVDLRRVGAWRYARHRSTIPLVLCFSIDDGEVLRWRPLREEPPAALTEAARRAAAGGAVFRAWNAAFERNIWNYCLRRFWPELPALPREAFVCTMAQALAGGWPASLGEATEAMGADELKDSRGPYLTRVCGSPRHALKPGLLRELEEYCDQDVRAERAAAARLRPLSRRERRIWLLDQEINDRGVRIDVPAARAVLRVVLEATERVNAELPKLTGGKVEKATQATRIREWLRAEGLELPDLKADTVASALERDDLTREMRAVLTARGEAGGAAVKKLTPMILVPDPDDWRARGLLQYHGAAATGRWAGRLIQPQNMPRPILKDADPEELIRAFTAGHDAVAAVFGDVFAAASDALRPLITATPGNVLVRADLAAIEARIVLWLAGHDDAMKLFRTGACIYCEMASAVYGFRVTKQDNPGERQVGKVIVLGCGYQMGGPRFREHAASSTPPVLVTLEQATAYVNAYRERWFRVPLLWKGLEQACLRAVMNGGVHSYRGVDFAVFEGALQCRIPSGRVLTWQGVEVHEGMYGPQVWVMRMKGGRWEPVCLYGGILTERVTQALARDVMAEAMLRAEDEGLPVVLTVHDEAVADTNRVDAGKVLVQCMTSPMPWAPDLPLAAEADSSFRYGK